MNENEQFFLNSNEVLCPKCGAICIEEHLFCAVCGNPMKVENVSDGNLPNGTVYVTSTNNNIPVVNQPEKDNSYIPWLIAAWVGGPCGLFLSMVHGSFSIIGSLVSLISIIYVKIKYSDVTAVKVSFWIIMIIYVLLLIAFLAVLALLLLAFKSCSEGMY